MIERMILPPSCSMTLVLISNVSWWRKRTNWWSRKQFQDHWSSRCSPQQRRPTKPFFNTCAVPFAEGRKALLGRVAAGTALAELEVLAKVQDIRLKGATGAL